MDYRINFLQLAEVYNCDSYGAGAYDQGGVCATSNDGGGTTTNPGTNSGTVTLQDTLNQEVLAGTGVSLYAALIAGMVLLVVSAGIIVGMVVKRKKSRVKL